MRRRGGLEARRGEGGWRRLVAAGLWAGLSTMGWSAEVAGRTAPVVAEPPAVRGALERIGEGPSARGFSGRGLVVGVFSDGDGERYRQDLREIRELGASHVLLVVQEAMTDIEATEISPRDWLTPSPERLERVLETARELGLGIVLMPSLYVEETSDGEWRGALAPTDWDAWWRSYEAFILRYARLAARHGVEVFCIGSELCSTETQRERWALLILRVRRETPSLISYSFNWDHLRQGRIADLLDLAGMNAYHDVPSGPEASLSDTIRAWERIRRQVGAWQEGHGRPIFFTEVGYRSVEQAGRSPWDYLDERSYDGESQRHHVEAFLEAWSDAPGLAGIFFYAWRGDGGPGDTTYTPRGKPAEALLRSWLSETWLSESRRAQETRHETP